MISTANASGLFGGLSDARFTGALERGRLVAVTTRRRAMTSRTALTRLLDKVPSRIEREFVRFIEASEW